jgi:hypothetical protein
MSDRRTAAISWTIILTTLARRVHNAGRSMRISVTWQSGPLLRKEGLCACCGQPFACELSVGGCWCSAVPLTDADRATLKANYKGCLCPACLNQIAATQLLV